MVKGGGEDLTRSGGQVKRGEVEAKRKTVNLQALRAEQQRAEAQALEQLKALVEHKVGANPKLAALKSQLAAPWCSRTCASCCTRSARCWPRCRTG